MTHPSGSTEDHVAAWLARPEISARTVLVTILGDIVRPVASSLWLAQLFELCDPFSFSQRLVRTSLSRLGSDGWVESERIGRQSRYSLTTLAIRESTDADSRIYSNAVPPWDGTWTLLLINRDDTPTKVLDRLVQHLRWHGFCQIDRTVLVAPNVSQDETRQLVDLIAPGTICGTGEARFDDVDALTGRGLFDNGTTDAAIEGAYTKFLRDWEPVADVASRPMEPSAAYILRVMLIHDLRRIVLRPAPRPRELLPSPWVGDRAFILAGRLYHSLAQQSASWLSNVLDQTYPAVIAGRFAQERVSTAHKPKSTN